MSNLDRSLDEILRDRPQNSRGSHSNRGGNRGNRGGGRAGRGQRERSDYPRDGVKKSYRDDTSRNINDEWVHDRHEQFDRRDNEYRSEPRYSSRRQPSPDLYDDANGTVLRVEGLHYDLTKADLDELFSRIGRVLDLNLLYDNAGRSQGTAFVTYELHHDATKAISEFDGANAKGERIRVTMQPSGPRGRRLPRDSGNIGRPLEERITYPSRPLEERITYPSRRLEDRITKGRTRSLSPAAQDDDDEAAARKGIDRYRPDRSRSPLRRGRREAGRRPGQRRDESGREDNGRGGRGGRGRGGRGGNVRPKKTAEELDAEMDDYFKNRDESAAEAAPAGDVNVAPVEDVDMIE